MVQGTVPGPAALAASLPAFFMTFNFLLLNEFPDEAADREGGRRHLIILFGRTAAARTYAAAALAALIPQRYPHVIASPIVPPPP